MKNLYMVRYFTNNHGIVDCIDEPFIYLEDAELFLKAVKRTEDYLYGAVLRYDPFEPDKRYKWKVV